MNSTPVCPDHPTPELGNIEENILLFSVSFCGSPHLPEYRYPRLWPHYVDTRFFTFLTTVVVFDCLPYLGKGGLGRLSRTGSTTEQNLTSVPAHTRSVVVESSVQVTSPSEVLLGISFSVLNDFLGRIHFSSLRCSITVFFPFIKTKICYNSLKTFSLMKIFNSYYPKFPVVLVPPCTQTSCLLVTLKVCLRCLSHLNLLRHTSHTQPSPTLKWRPNYIQNRSRLLDSSSNLFSLFTFTSAKFLGTSSDRPSNYQEWSLWVGARKISTCLNFFIIVTVVKRYFVPFNLYVRGCDRVLSRLLT